MGDPKSRKRKSKTVNAEENESKVLELPVEEVSESEERTPKTQNNKKTKVLEVSTEEVRGEDSKPKTKKNKKTKVLEISTEHVAESEENDTKPKKAKKNKDLDTTTEEVNESELKEVKTKKAKKHKLVESKEQETEEGGENDGNKHKPKKAKKQKNPSDIRSQEVPEELKARYPLLTDKALAEKFMAVSLKPQLRTRLRQQLRNKFHKISTPKLPEAIHSHAQSILESPELSENDLRRVRLLVNMLRMELLVPGSFHKQAGEGSDEKTAEDQDADGATNVPIPNPGVPAELVARYPLLGDGALVKRFLAVHCRNNQKGRIRQNLKDSLKGTSETLLPDVIHSRMQAILKTPELSDPDLRKLRILYNMLRTALQAENVSEKKKKKPKEKKEKKLKEKKEADENEDPEEKKEKGEDNKQKEQKVKGPKRYVVFVGNLPLDITKEKLSEHFSDLGDRLKDVRIPKPAENKKSAIAYLELADDLSFELALSKHHTMLDNKRINVLYSTQQNSKVSKAEAKGKAAKLVAMQKSGQLAGSIPLSKKRSARRNKMKAAQKKHQEALEQGA